MVQYDTDGLDASFAALSDATRRGVLEQLGLADASITDLAEKFHMTLRGIKKHVGVLEQAGLYRLLDPTRTGVTLDSLQRAASALGLTLNISFEAPPRRSAARPHGLTGRRKKRAA
jgi:DNA-binding transcriptional ArsR family regulator